MLRISSHYARPVYLPPLGLDRVDEVAGVEGDWVGALSAAGFECRQIMSDDANDFDFFVFAGFACALCCVACGAIRPAWQPTP